MARSKQNVPVNAAVKPAGPVPATEKPSLNELDGLKRWNRSLAALHGLQGLAILILATAKSFPVTTNYLGLDSLSTAAQRQPVLAQAMQHLFDVRLAYLVALFFFISAIAHMLVAGKFRFRYETELRVGLNRFRWVEYAFSASLMLVAIGLLAGISDLSSLLMIFSFSFIMNLCGLLMELYNQRRATVDWKLYLLGCLAGIVPWIVILIYLISSQLYGSGVPGFVWAIFVSLFIFFDCFALNMFLQYKKIGRWQRYLYGERVYMLLSLVAKTALAWQIFAGSLRP